MNRRLLTLGVSAAIAASAVLTGCGTETVSSGSAPASAAPSTPAPSTSAPGATTMVQAIQSSVGVTDQGRTVTVSATVGGCRVPHLVPQETSQTVTLTVRITSNRKPGQMCPDFAKLTPVSAKLKAPLGDRTVIDGADGHHLRAHDTKS